MHGGVASARWRVQGGECSPLLYCEDQGEPGPHAYSAVPCVSGQSSLMKHRREAGRTKRPASSTAQSRSQRPSVIRSSRPSRSASGAGVLSAAAACVNGPLLSIRKLVVPKTASRSCVPALQPPVSPPAGIRGRPDAGSLTLVCARWREQPAIRRPPRTLRPCRCIRRVRCGQHDAYSHRACLERRS